MSLRRSDLLRLLRRKRETPDRSEDLARMEEDIIDKARRLIRLEAEAGIAVQPFFLKDRRGRR